MRRGLLNLSTAAIGWPLRFRNWKNKLYTHSYFKGRLQDLRMAENVFYTLDETQRYEFVPYT